MLLLKISIFTSLIGAGIFELGVKTILLAVFVNAFKALIGIIVVGSLFFAIRKLRS
jgi:hypothetical protein